MRCARPVRACAAVGRVAYRVEPVRTKRPGLESALSSALIASSTAGSCWNSSTSTGLSAPMNRAGSAETASRVSRSSRSRIARPHERLTACSSVDFPTARGPCSTRTGSSCIRLAITSARRRGTTADSAMLTALSIADFFRISRRYFSAFRYSSIPYFEPCYRGDSSVRAWRANRTKGSKHHRNAVSVARKTNSTPRAPRVRLRNARR
jgi:hypothetical protein